MGVKCRYTWTCLVQGFKNSSKLFGEALAFDLKAFAPQEGTVVLQYMNDILVASHTWEECLLATQEVLQILWRAGYKVSQKKAQICKQQVTYLGYIISHGTRKLGPERIEAVCGIPLPGTERN